jgi:hypothetical protein
MLEKSIEAACRKKARGAGGYLLKLNPVGVVGIPDRMLLLPAGRIAFLEFKRPGQQLRPKQQQWFRKLGRIGFLCVKVDSVEQFEELLSAAQS